MRGGHSPPFRAVPRRLSLLAGREHGRSGRGLSPGSHSRADSDSPAHALTAFAAGSSPFCPTTHLCTSVLLMGGEFSGNQDRLLLGRCAWRGAQRPRAASGSDDRLKSATAAMVWGVFGGIGSSAGSKSIGHTFIEHLLWAGHWGVLGGEYPIVSAPRKVTARKESECFFLVWVEDGGF